MTVTGEMREAGYKAIMGCRSSLATDAAEAAYLAMRPLDPEFQELRKELAESQAIRADLLRGMNEVNDRCSRLAALRPVVEAAVSYEEWPYDRERRRRLGEAVRALPAEWRG